MQRRRFLQQGAPAGAAALVSPAAVAGAQSAAPPGNQNPYTEKVLSTQDLADIYAFLQARPRPPAVSTIPQLAP